MENETGQQDFVQHLLNELEPMNENSSQKQEERELKKLKLSTIMKSAIYRTTEEYKSDYQKFKESFTEAFDEYYKEQDGVIEQAPTYTYKEIINPYTPNKKLEKDVKKSESTRILAYEEQRKTKKGLKPLKSLELKKPKNQKSVDENFLLQFEFDKKHKFRLVLTIFDNQGNPVDIPVKDIEQDKSLKKKEEDILVTKNTRKFSLLLKSLPPGIYYWRLKPKSEKREDDYKFVTRSFYIRKDLMPRESQDNDD